MEYKIGQTVVHLSHGIGIVKGIEEREFSPNKRQRFYILEIPDNGAPKKVFVPFESAGTRLRAVIDVATAQSVLAYIKAGVADLDTHATWNRRYREYMELIHTGDAMQIARVYLALLQFQSQSELSFGERKLLDHAHTRLSKELELVGYKLEVTNEY